MQKLPSASENALGKEGQCVSEITFIVCAFFRSLGACTPRKFLDLSVLHDAIVSQLYTSPMVEHARQAQCVSVTEQLQSISGIKLRARIDSMYRTTFLWRVWRWYEAIG